MTITRYNLKNIDYFNNRLDHKEGNNRPKITKWFKNNMKYAPLNIRSMLLKDQTKY